MSDDGRVVTANIPIDLASQLDAVADWLDRSKSWIVRQAVSAWLAEEQHRYELTLEALIDVDTGRTIAREDVLSPLQQARRHRA